MLFTVLLEWEQLELQIISMWIKANKLSANNIHKTNYVILKSQQRSHRSNILLLFDGNQLSQDQLLNSQGHHA